MLTNLFTKSSLTEFAEPGHPVTFPSGVLSGKSFSLSAVYAADLKKKKKLFIPHPSSVSYFATRIAFCPHVLINMVVGFFLPLSELLGIQTDKYFLPLTMSSYC